MARRKRTMVDGKIIEDEGGTIQSALEAAGRQDVSHVIAGGELITAEHFDRPATAHDMITNQTDIEKGATLREYLLNREFDLITTRFLAQFSGIPRSLELTDSTLFIRGFPLPDSYSPDHIDLLFLISGYPDTPPARVLISCESSQRRQIVDHLGGHVSTYIPSSDLELAQKLSNSICFHYKNHKWKLNPFNLLGGDCLYKFCENLFVALSGGYK